MISESASTVDGDRDVARLARVTARAGTAPAATGSLLPPGADEGARRRFLETALQLFGERGFHAVSVRDITGAMGLQASSLYAHVPSKQHLLGELIRLGHEEHRDALRLALLEAGSEPEEQIGALTRAHVQVHATYPLLTRVCNRELGSLPEDQRAPILAIRLDAERLFLDVIARGQRLGAFADTDPTLAVAAIGAMGMRVAEWWSPDVGMTAEHVADTYASFAVKLLT
ncbi:MAG: TetR family transcriptional regulator [Frankiales bacterium]|nr:TetR family transcriptional regulator [Frankiales bacterium]